MIGLNVSADRPDDVGDAIKDGTYAAIQEAAQAGFAESQRQVPVAFGDLKESGELRRGEQSATFGYKSDHAPFVEGGTEPHWPPIEPLKEWAALVLGDEDAAYAVQQKIADVGTDPQPFMGPAFRTAVRELQRRGLSPTINGQL
jgi:hypothetical protein